MPTHNFNCRIAFFLLLASFIFGAHTSSAQIPIRTSTPTAFTYQGRLTDADAPASGVYDFEFKLFDQERSGTQQGTTQTLADVRVTNGVFTVTLDFGADVFTPPVAKFLEIGIRPGNNLNAPFTILNPRQPINSVPYAVQARNASLLGELSASNFLRNTTDEQANVNFHIGGDGTAGGTLTGSVVRANSQFNIGNNRILSAPEVSNTFVGFSSGSSHTTGHNNTFVGRLTGFDNTSGSNNSFFGYSAGTNNINGHNNSFFGRSAGANNTSGIDNSFFGSSAGALNTTASNNSFFGHSAGSANTSGTRNSFFGKSAGETNSGGADNSFVGAFAGDANTTGANNSFFGSDAGGANTTGFSNSFFGSDTGDSNTSGNSNSFFGRSAGQANTTGNVNSFFGASAGIANTIGYNNNFFGNNAGDSNTSGNLNSFFGSLAGHANTTGENNTFVGTNAGDTNTSGDNNTVIGGGADVGNSNLINATAIGAGAIVSTSNTVMLGRSLDTVRAPGNFIVSGSATTRVLQITGGSDLAEHFHITKDFDVNANAGEATLTNSIKPGMVVAIDPRHAGKLTLARGAYNRRVAGIISGANNLAAGMVLPDPSNAEGSMPVALSGRVWVYADATRHAITPGDLLTTSALPGHAMRVTNHTRAQGAIIGKAMTELRAGKGLVLVLVTLQ